MQANPTIITENGALSLGLNDGIDPRVAFFFKTVRDTPVETVNLLLSRAWQESPLDTLKLVFHLRDCRGGKGEKKQFHFCLTWLLANHQEELRRNFDSISFYGSYKDWLFFLGTALEKEMVTRFTAQLTMDKGLLASPDPKVKGTISLASKWAPTEGCAHDREHEASKKFAGGLGVKKVVYRKEYLVPLREHLRIVESSMCEGDWESIDYSKVPSVALKRYKKAFQKHSPEKYKEFLEKVKAGTVKMNVNRLHPHEILEPYLAHFSSFSGNATTVDETVEVQWKVFVENIRTRWAEKGLGNAIVMSDVSGSMSGVPICVSVSLGILIAELATGPFHNRWITFSSDAKIEEIHGANLLEKINNMVKTHWDMNTNFQSAFDNLLTTAKMFNVPPAQMPTSVIIISDMEWDTACPNNDRTNYEEIERKYDEAGYKRPRLIFWNVRTGNGDIQFPVTSSVPNCALVSGFSSDLLDIFLTGEQMNPYQVMRKAIDAPRYDRVVA